MKNLILPMVLLALAAGCDKGFVLHVAPKGDDANPGTDAKPLATPAGARDALRTYRAKNGGLPPGGAVIEFANGEYRMTEALTLGAEDSGTPEAPVVWRAAHRGEAAFSGAENVTGWKTVSDPTVLARLPTAAHGKVLVACLPGTDPIPDFGGGSEECYSQRLNFPWWLYQDGRRLDCARWPNAPATPAASEEGYVFTGETVGGETAQDSFGPRSQSGVFRFRSPKLAAWTKEPELWTYGLFLHEYADMKMSVTNIDAAAETIALDNRYYPRGFKRHAPFYVFNALSELDKPGEWVLDRAARKVYLWPLGDIAAKPPIFGKTLFLVAATNLACTAFEGLVFEYPRRDALLFANSSNVVVRACAVRHTGAWGVTVTGGTAARVEGCDLTDLGEGGIRLSGGDPETLAPARHAADNNHISHYGQVIPSYRPGVSLAGVGCEATHNLIHHSVHQGVWFNGNDHRIAFNVIHDTCLYNDDAGAIYCCQRDWTKRGTVIEYNLVHMTGKQPCATADDAVYLDDFSSGNVVRGNILNRASLGVHVGGGNGNVVEKNVICGTERAVLLGGRRGKNFGGVHEQGAKSYLYQKILKNRTLIESEPRLSRYPELARLFTVTNFALAHDPLFNRISGNVSCASGPFHCPLRNDIAPYLTETNNLDVAGDPGFTDYPRLDFSLKSDSPARKVIGGDTRFAEMGLYASPWRFSPPVKYGEGVTYPHDAPQRPYAAPAVRVDFIYGGQLPEGETAMAEDFVNCELLASQKGRRVYAAFGRPDFAEWKEYTCAFTPRFDCKISFSLSGAFGEKTWYDDFRVTGIELNDPGFEGAATGGAWRTDGILRDARGNVADPCGLVKDVRAAQGGGIAAACHERQTGQTVQLRKGRRVTVAFKAREF
jgi:hypothetical protein